MTTTLNMIATTNAHVELALAFKNKISSMYVALGQPNPWPDESNPPAVTDTTTALTDLIGYKLVSLCTIVRPPNNGETVPSNAITYGGNNWIIVADTDAITQNAHWVYTEASITDSDLPDGSFRQVGLYTDVVPMNGVSTPNLLPNQVSNSGILWVYANNVSQNLASGVTITQPFLQEF